MVKVITVIEEKQWFFYNTIAARKLVKIPKNSRSNSAKAVKKMAIYVMKKHKRALERGAKIGIAAVNKIPQTALSTIPDVISFYHTGNALYLGKIVQVFR